MTSTIKKRSVRPLGFYPTLNQQQLQDERRLFQQRIQMLNTMMEQHQLASFRGVTSSASTRDHRVSVMCSDRYNPELMNDANFAKNFSRVPKRVASAGASCGFSSPEESSVCTRESFFERTDMGKLQCEVLGSYLCSDCIRIKRVESVAQEKRDMYPEIKVDTRSLIAPAKVQRFNSSLPSQFYNERRSLECGCIVHLDHNFWNPVIFTETNVFDRVRQASKTTKMLNHINAKPLTLQREMLNESRRREEGSKTKKSLPVDFWTLLPAKSSVPQHDMKVTVTFAKRNSKSAS